MRSTVENVLPQEHDLSQSDRRNLMSNFRTFRKMYWVIGRGETTKTLFDTDSNTKKKRNTSKQSTFSSLSKLTSMFLPTKSEGSVLKAKALGRRSLGIILVLVLSVYMVGLFGFLGYKIPQADLPSLFNTVLTVTLFIALMFGVLTGVTRLYYTQDLKYYLSLPISGSIIMWAKLLRHLFSMMLMEMFPFMLWVGAAFRMRVHPVLYVQATLAYVVSIVILNLVFMAIIIPLMRFSKFAHNQDRFMRVSGALVMIFALALGVISQYFFNGDSEISSDQFTHTVNFIGDFANGKIAHIIFGIICPAIPLSKGIFSSSLLTSLASVACLMLVMAAYFVVVGFFGNLWYFESVRSMQNSGGSRSARFFSQSELTKKVAARSSLQAHTAQTFKKWNRTPAFFTNLMLPNLLMPLYIIAIILVVSLGRLSSIPGTFASKIQVIRDIGSTVTLGTWMFSATLLVMMGMVFAFSTASYQAMIAVSAEGEDFFYLKAMPIRWRSYALAKLAVSSIQMLLMLALILIGLILFNVPVVTIVLTVTTYVITTVSSLVIAFIVGVFTHNFDWNDETELIKGGGSLLRSFGGMLTAILVVALPVVILVLQLSGVLPWLSASVAQLSAVVLLTLELVGLLALLLTIVVRKFDSIEN